MYDFVFFNEFYFLQLHILIYFYLLFISFNTAAVCILKMP